MRALRALTIFQKKRPSRPDQQCQDQLLEPTHKRKFQAAALTVKEIVKSQMPGTLRPKLFSA
jgi:hypothetical protein